MAKYFICTLTLFFLLIPSVGARVYLDINDPTFVQIPIVLPKWKSVAKTPPALTAKVYEVLVNNLTLSGFFKVIDHSLLPVHLKDKEGIPSMLSIHEWASTGGEILLSGEAGLEGDGLNLRLKFHLVDLIERRHLTGKQYDGHLQHFRNMVHRIADETILHFTGEKGVHTTKIAYVMRQDQSREIFVADFDGANVRPVTQNQSINISPAWTPDGLKIAFTSYLKRNPDLYLIDLNRKSMQSFSSYPGLNASPSWSPDGKQIALMLGKEGKSDIYLLDARGENPRRLTSGHGNESTPRWSPDGQQIVFSSDRSGSPQIYIMASNGSNVRRLTFEGNYNVSPSWSPKGERIVFCGRSGGRFHIFSIGIDGSGLRKLTPDGGNNESPCWSPDGRYIAFSSTRMGGSKIFIMNANGFNQRPLTESKGGESSPAWSKRFE
jgi:TolB protein